VRTNITDSERNWPSELGELPERPIEAQVVRPHFERAIDEGMTPAAVADLVATAVGEDRFWVLPHADWMPMAFDRWDRIREGLNPEPLEEIPGMPSRTQMIEEAMTALMEQSEPE
jgi:hypothetical protein